MTDTMTTRDLEIEALAISIDDEQGEKIVKLAMRYAAHKMVEAKEYEREIAFELRQGVSKHDISALVAEVEGR